MKRIINLRKFSSVSNNVMNMNIKGNIGIVDINNPLSAVNVINESFSKDLLEILDVKRITINEFYDRSRY